MIDYDKSIEFQIRARRTDFSQRDGVQLYATQTQGGEIYIAQQLEFKSTGTKDRYQALASFLTISSNEAQRLMDDLWDAGLRPSEGTGSAGSLAATQKHLADMRTIVFKQLKMENMK